MIDFSKGREHIPRRLSVMNILYEMIIVSDRRI